MISRRFSQISPQIFADNFVKIVAVNLQFRVLSSYFQLLTSHFLFFISLPALKQGSWKVLADLRRKNQR